jgi:hypothetical protein
MYCVICNQSHSASHMRSKAHLSRKKQIYQDLTTLSKKEIEQLYQGRLPKLIDQFELTLLDSHIWDGMRSPKMEKLFLKSKSRSRPETLSPPETEECRLSKVPGISP